MPSFVEIGSVVLEDDENMKSVQTDGQRTTGDQESLSELSANKMATCNN